MSETEVNKGKIVSIIIIIILVLAAAGAAIFILRPGYISVDSAVEGYYNAISTENASKYKHSCYTSKWEKNYLSGANTIELDTTVSSAFSMQSGASYSDVSVISTEDLGDNYVAIINESIQRIYGTDVNVTKLYRVNFTMQSTYNGTKTSTGTLTRYCYKSGGKWFFLADVGVIVDTGLE